MTSEQSVSNMIGGYDDVVLVDDRQERAAEQVYPELQHQIGEPFYRRWVQAVTDVLRSWLFLLFWLCLAIFFTVVLGLLGYRWLSYGCLLVQRAIWSHFDSFWALLDYYSPSATEEDRVEKQKEVREKVEHILQRTINLEKYHFWKWLEWYETATLLICGLLVLAMVCHSIGMILKSLSRRVQEIRGVQFESVRAGSQFVPGQMPACQVAIRALGTFSNTHLGYGIRKGSYLVTPRHVLIESNGQMVKEVNLLGVGIKSVNTTLVVEQSLVEDDLVYCYISDNVWSVLGTAKGKWSRDSNTVYAQCYGLPGVSTGRVTKTAIRWQLAYTGSTVPGMSGAAYIHNGQVYGMHTGSAVGYNVGISSVLISAELSQIGPRRVASESSTGNYDDAGEQYVTRFKNSSNVWSDTKALDDLVKRYKDDPWTSKTGNDDDDDFWNQKLSFGEESSKKKSVPTLTLNPGAAIKLTNQGAGGDERVMVSLNEDDHHYMSRIRSEGILERVQKLESVVMGARPKNLEPKQVVTEKSVTNVCSQCGQSARNAERLAKHVANSHPVKTESAIPEDTGKASKMVKQGRFLGTRMGSQKPSGPPLKKNLSSSKQKDQFQSPGVNLSDLMVSQKNIVSSLNELLAVMRGQASETKQN